MRLQNRSSRPTEEVRRLVAFATRGVRLDRVAVHVKNGQGGGRAYEVVPSLSPRAKQSTVDRLITIGIAPDSAFPYSNVHLVTQATKWGPKLPEGTPAPTPRDGWAIDSYHWFEGGVRTIQYRERRDIRQPYGGKGSPLIEVRDWREGLVAVAAHEARHIWQFQHDKPRSEVDAERFAAKALARYREAVQP